MDKNAIKKYAIYARNKLIQSATDKALTIGVSKNEIRDPDVQGDNYIIFTSSLGTETTLTGDQINARNKLINEINNKGFDEVIEEVAYTWFNRLIAIRFMEVNDYLPSRLRVLSSDISGKKESDLMSNPFDADLNLTDEDKKNIITYKENNNLNELFNLLFVKQCNKLNELLPGLFERTNEFTELLLDIRYDDSEDVVYKLVHDIPEEDFDVSKGGQVEIIGWLYQYYNTELKDEVFKGLKKNKKITKENIPAATQLFTPDWIVRYMVENSLGRLWIEGHPDEELKSKWKYYLDDAKQEPEVQQKLNKIYEEHSHLQPTDIKVIDPAMGSGHILVYMFDVLMQIYESQGYSQREAAELILENNLYGLDIDKRAYQLSYFSVMMKARQYNRRFFSRHIQPHVIPIMESNDFDSTMIDYFIDKRQELKEAINSLITDLHNAKEYGSILNIKSVDFSILYSRFDEIKNSNFDAYTSLILETLLPFVQSAEIMAKKYHVVCTNPPYMGSGNMTKTLSDFLKMEYPNTKSDMSTVFMEKATKMCLEMGYISMINIPVWMFIVRYEKFRQWLLKNITFINLTHPGRGIFGSDFGTVVFTLLNKDFREYKGRYFRLFNDQGEVKSPDDRRKAFLKKIGEFCTKQKNYERIPGFPIAYWISEEMIKGFDEGIQLKQLGQTTKGIITGNNDKYLRLWWEVSNRRINLHAKDANDAYLSKDKWFPCTKGGSFRKWYGNKEYIIDWENRGYRVLNDATKENRHSQDYDDSLKFKPGITWSGITSSITSFRFEVNHLVEHIGMCIFPFDEDNLDICLGFTNSKVAEKYLSFLSPTIAVNAGEIDKLPIIIPSKNVISNIDCIVNKNIKMEKEDWDSFETSWDFELHPLVKWKKSLQNATETNGILDQYLADTQEVSCPLELCYTLWQGECDERFNQLKNNEEEINRIFIDIYGLQGELIPEEEDKDVTVRKADLGRDIKSLISYAVGCMFGRYSLDEEGLVCACEEFDIGRYRSFKVDPDNIIPITDEEYFNDDIVGRFVEFIKIVYGVDTLEENLGYIAKALGNKGDTSREVIRNYFEKDFIKDHIKIYKKRPIYWLFNSGKQNGFKALIYMHRYNENTVSNVRTEYLHKIQDVYAKTIEDDQYTIDHSSSKSDINKARKHITKLQKQLDETKLYDTALAHIANERFVIDLDDGVKVNYAKFQDIEIINDNGKKVKVNLLEKI